jgi:hypothetical protein
MKRACLNDVQQLVTMMDEWRDNAPAQAVYRRVGFIQTDRQLLALRLADPTHED